MDRLLLLKEMFEFADQLCGFKFESIGVSHKLHLFFPEYRGEKFGIILTNRWYAKGRKHHTPKVFTFSRPDGNMNGIICPCRKGDIFIMFCREKQIFNFYFYIIGATIFQRPVPCDGSTIIGKCDNSLTAATAASMVP